MRHHSYSWSLQFALSAKIGEDVDVVSTFMVTLPFDENEECTPTYLKRIIEERCTITQQTLRSKHNNKGGEGKATPGSLSSPYSGIIMTDH